MSCTVMPHQTESTLPAGSQSEPSLTEKNAAVLGLMSFVLSSPYEVPLWLPDVLLSLIKAASQPAPVKTTVRWAPGQHLDLGQHPPLQSTLDACETTCMCVVCPFPHCVVLNLQAHPG